MFPPALLLFGVAPPVDTVEIDGARYRELSSHAKKESSAPGPSARHREVTLRPTEGGFELRARWTIETARGGWLKGVLAGPAIRIERASIGGKPLPILTSPIGAYVLTWIDKRSTIDVVGFVAATEADAIELDLLPATRGRLNVDDPTRVPIPADDGPGVGFVARGRSVLGGGRRLALHVREPTTAGPPPGPLTAAHTAIGITVGDAEIRGRARLRWDVRRGSIEEVRASVHGIGDDLSVTGEGIGAWTRDGDELRVELPAPVRGRVDIELSWSVATPRGSESRIAIPKIVPHAWHADAAIQLARDGEIEVVPDLDAWDPIAHAELPEWGQGLVEGSPTAAFRAGGADREGALALVRFVPVPGPPIVVDVAAYTIATTAEGRLLARAHYELRNERASHLRITPPDGVTIIGARVSGETARPARDDDGTWLVPLKRSLETVGGPLSFPVEVVLMGTLAPWQRRERRELPLPVLDAPVAASRVTLYLPPDYTSRLGSGRANVVDAFTEGEGITYGLGSGEVGAAHADALFQDAVAAYVDNDFDKAQARLDDLGKLGARNENTQRLQANLDLVAAKERSGKADVALERRIREQARARATDDFRRQQQLDEEAEALEIAGDYEAAEEKLTEAIVLGDKLAALDQEESVEQDVKNIRLAGKRSRIIDTKYKRKGRGVRQTRASSQVIVRGPTSAATPAGQTLYDFDDDTIDLPHPDGGEIAAPPAADPRAADVIPPPVVTASALAVVIPAIGEPVRYQELLVQAGQAPRVRIDARRRLFRRRAK